MKIGFTGKMGSGKTTACDYLLSKRPFKKVSFKSALINEIRDNFPTLLEDLADHYAVTIDALFTLKPPMMRHLMQEYGTDVRRSDDPDYWVNRWKEGVEGDVLTDDVRFLNEAQAVRDMGGIVIRLVRPSTFAGTHKSEVEMDLIEPDVTIITEDGDLEGLYRQLDGVLEAQATP